LTDLLLKERADLALVLNLEELLAAIGRVGDVELGGPRVSMTLWSIASRSPVEFGVKGRGVGEQR
jgi:hypothetical protein